MATTKATGYQLFDLTSLDLSKLNLGNMPKVDLPKVDAEGIVNAAKDAAYIGVGVAVLAFQKLQSARRDMTKSLNGQYDDGRAQFDEFVTTLDTRLGGLESRFDAAVEGLGKRLPEQAGAALDKAHDATKAARKQVRQTVNKAA